MDAMIVRSSAAEHRSGVFSGIEDGEQPVRVECVLQRASEQSVRERVLSCGIELSDRVPELASDHEVPQRDVASE